MYALSASILFFIFLNVTVSSVYISNFFYTILFVLFYKCFAIVYSTWCIFDDLPLLSPRVESAEVNKLTLHRLTVQFSLKLHFTGSLLTGFHR